MRCLQDLKVVNAAVFIIRYYGGVNVGAARFKCMEKLAKTALRKAHLIRSPSRGPITRSKAQHWPSHDPEDTASQPPSRASSFGIPSKLEAENDSDSLRTADDDLHSQLDSEASVITDEDEQPQVVTNYVKEQQGFTSAVEDVATYADNEASESETPAVEPK